MGKIIAYLQASTDKQDTNCQKLELLEFSRKRFLSIDEFAEIAISSRQAKKERRMDGLMAKLVEADTLIVTELSRLGRSAAEVISLVNSLAQRNIRVIVTKQNLDIGAHDINSRVIITLLSLFAELERDLISLRTKEALASKKRMGQVLGKPKGIIQKSKLDNHADKIKELLGYGLSVRKIANVLGYKNHIALNTYIRKGNFRENLA